MKKQTRNLNPIPEAVFAMYHWSKDYSKQMGGCMDFYDSLSNFDKDFCKRAVEAIDKAGK